MRCLHTLQTVQYITVHTSMHSYTHKVHFKGESLLHTKKVKSAQELTVIGMDSFKSFQGHISDTSNKDVLYSRPYCNACNKEEKKKGRKG